jgi:hypothetical protein
MVPSTATARSVSARIAPAQSSRTSGMPSRGVSVEQRQRDVGPVALERLDSGDRVGPGARGQRPVLAPCRVSSS